MSSGYWACINCGQTATEGSNGDIIVTAPQYVWVPNFLPNDFGINWDTIIRSMLGAVGNELDQFAENYLKPPAGRQRGESTSQCLRRITGWDPALAISGASGIGAGPALLGYPRSTLAGGGSGTSLISSAARGSFGNARLGFRLFGTGSIGGAIGRGISLFSAAGGAAMLGYAAGHGVGAFEVCK